MCKAKGFSVKIFIPSGDPAGLRLVEKSNWTGRGLVFPRSVLLEARKRPELTGAGVYVIWGPGESGQIPRVYIGEGTGLVARLDSHAKEKDFWTYGAVFTSKDQNLNKAHIQYLEARLVGLAGEAKRCELDNAKKPQLPSLADADAADAELYLDDMLLCLPVVGVSFFEKPGTPTQTTRPLFLQVKGMKARGYEDAGGFVVRSGSQAVKDEAPAIHAYMSDLRTALKKQGILANDGGFYRMTQDYTFGSPSTAAGVLLGRASNGRVEWKAADGRSLKELQEEDAQSP